MNTLLGITSVLGEIIKGDAISNSIGEWHGQGMVMNSFLNLKRILVRESLCRCRDELWGCHSCSIAASSSESSLGESQEERDLHL